MRSFVFGVCLFVCVMLCCVLFFGYVCLGCGVALFYLFVRLLCVRVFGLLLFVCLCVFVVCVVVCCYLFVVSVMCLFV